MQYTNNTGIHDVWNEKITQMPLSRSCIINLYMHEIIVFFITFSWRLSFNFMHVYIIYSGLSLVDYGVICYIE